MADIEIEVTQLSVDLAVDGVDSVTAGTGLLGDGVPGGVIVGAGTIAVNFAPNGSGTSVQVPTATDARLSNARTPTTHKTTHEVGGSDELVIAQSQVTNLSTDLSGKVSTTRQIVAGTGLTGGGDLTVNRTLAVDIAPDGAGSASQVPAATDTRLSNARTPTSHAGTHGIAGSDPLPAGSLAQSQVANLVSDLAGKVPTSRQVLAGTGLTGGGNLGSDVTLTCDFAASGVASAGKPVEATDSRLANSRSPNGAAGGDLSGTYPNPAVANIASRPVDPATPSTGDVFVYSGLQWNHVPQATITTNAGTFANQPINATAPLTNEVWQFNGSQWNHVAPTTLATEASLANYLPSGVGASARTVASRLNDVVSVKDFGAVGDGVADDGPAIAAALASSANTVFMPQGTYRITSSIQLPSNKTLRGDGIGTVIQADSVTGAAIVTFVGSWTGTFSTFQHLKDFTISGTCTHGVLWICTVYGSIERVNITNCTCTNGFVADGAFVCTFKQLDTGGSTISNACFWAARDFNANHLDTLHTSNFCAANFLSQKTGASAISPYSPVANYTGSGSTLTNICCQGGDVGMALYGVDFGGWTINTPRFENVVLPIQLGSLALAELCRSVTINSPMVPGAATATSHPNGPSTHALDIDNAVNVTINSPEFGSFGDSTPPLPSTVLIHYHTSHKVTIHNFYLSFGSLGSKITNQIKRKAGADADGGVFILGEEVDSTNTFRSHFMLMKSENYGFEHWKMSVTSAGVWTSQSIVPPLV